MATKAKTQKVANEAKTNDAVVKRVIKRHGAMIDLEKNPGAIIDIIRRFGPEVAANDNPCGGTPPSPGPGKAGGRVTNEEVLRAVLRLAREFDALKKSVAGRG
jgi:hypothetical protein